MSIRKLLRSATPAIFMMIAISIYSVVDGFFVSNFAGKAQFASVNLIYPVIMILASLGFMMGSGGAALVSKRLGEGKYEEANQAFSNCFYASLALGVISSIAAYFLMPSLALWLGADEEMLPYCISYGRIMVIGITFFNLQNLFQSFFQAAEKGRLGFLVTMIAGIVNIVLDAILIAGCGLGVFGAGIGTIIGQIVGAIIPIFYFVRKNKSPFQLTITSLDFSSIGKMASNGMSEFATNISASVVSMLLNIQLMKYYGQDGVGAYGIICYVWMIFAACFIGFNIAASPRISYSLGANNKEELNSLYRKSLLILLGMGIVQCALSLSLTVPIAHAFARYDEGLLNLTIHANLIYSLVYFFLGFNMFGSAFFTALNNGVVSLLLSFARLGVMEVLCVLFLPLGLGGEGIWWSIPLAEGLGTIMNLVVIVAFGKRYGYRKEKEKC